MHVVVAVAEVIDAAAWPRGFAVIFRVIVVGVLETIVVASLRYCTLEHALS